MHSRPVFLPMSVSLAFRRRAAAIAIACLLVAGCTIGDRIYTSNIDLLFPGKTKEQVRPLILTAGSACGYKKGGQWESNGRSYYDACRRENGSECWTRFKKNAVWVEAKDRTTAEAISFWFDFMDSEGWIILEPRVKIEDAVGGAKVQFDFSSLGTPLSPRERTEFYALKRCLTERYGPAVTTKNEP